MSAAFVVESDVFASLCMHMEASILFTLVTYDRCYTEVLSHPVILHSGGRSFKGLPAINAHL